MAEGLLKGLQQAVLIEKGKLSGLERVSTLSKPAPIWKKMKFNKKPTRPGEILKDEFLIPLNLTQKYLANHQGLRRKSY